MIIVVVDVELKIGPTIGKEAVVPSEPPTVIVGTGIEGGRPPYCGTPTGGRGKFGCGRPIGVDGRDPGIVTPSAPPTVEVGSMGGSGRPGTGPAGGFGGG